MKNQTIIRSLIAMIVLSFAISTSSCKKEKSAKEIQKAQINEVLPQKYIDTLIRMGITIHEGTTPPIVNGIYLANPTILLASTVVGDIIGNTFSDIKVKLTDQDNTNFGIKLYGKKLLGENDTSIVTAISGSGNNFTVYGKVKASATPTNYAIFAIVISGTLSADGIVNYQDALINIDNSKGATYFIPEGTGRLIKDGNNLASTTSFF
jgi:hypothetical protein